MIILYQNLKIKFDLKLFDKLNINLILISVNYNFNFSKL